MPEWAPVQGGALGLRGRLPAGRIPWEVHVLAWQEYHKGRYHQSAERIAERGGFGWSELIDLLRGEYMSGNAERQLREIQVTKDPDEREASYREHQS